MPSTIPNEIEKYITGFPTEIQKILKQLRSTIINAAPESEEIISYGMVSHKYKGTLLWYAAHKNHIGYYPTASPIQFFKEELANYKTSKGVIQFPIDKPLPLELITKIVTFKMNENILKSMNKTKKKK